MSNHYDRSEILQGLVTALQDMLIAAKNDDWEEVIRCNNKRHSLASQLRPTHQQTSDEIQIVSKLKEIDSEVAELAIEARDAAANGMHKMNGQKSNVNQYLQNQFS